MSRERYFRRKTVYLGYDPSTVDEAPSNLAVIGRYVFTGYREVRATMLAHGDDKPVWMTELGWNTQSTAPGSCPARPRRRRGALRARWRTLRLGTGSGFDIKLRRSEGNKNPSFPLY